MSEEEKMLWLFKEVHGEDLGTCHAEVYYEYYEPAGVDLVKDGAPCWSKSKVDLVFDYITKHIDGNVGEVCNLTIIYRSESEEDKLTNEIGCVEPVKANCNRCTVNYCKLSLIRQVLRRNVLRSQLLDTTPRC